MLERIKPSEKYAKNDQTRKKRDHAEFYDRVLCKPSIQKPQPVRHTELMR